MAEKHTTLAQMRLGALRSKAEMLAMLVDALEGVQVGMTITLPTANWASNKQTIQNVAFLADSDYWYFVCPNDACRDYGILAENIETDGEMTFQCQTVPESDITIYILRLEVET